MRRCPAYSSSVLQMTEALLPPGSAVPVDPEKGTQVCIVHALLIKHGSSYLHPAALELAGRNPLEGALWLQPPERSSHHSILACTAPQDFGVCCVKMAQRLALRRLLALGRRPLPLGPRPLASQGLPGRAFGSSAIRGSAFNVQDGGDFQERVVNSPKPVVVDFHAQWCGPCKILGPRLEKMVAKQEGKVVMAKVDIDDHTDLAIEYEGRKSFIFTCISHRWSRSFS